MKAGLVACSDGIRDAAVIKYTQTVLQSLGTELAPAAHLLANNGPYAGTDSERAADLMDMFRDPSIDEIYDLSGGDLASTLIDLLDYEAIRESRATLFGYSDLTSILNAIYARTGKESVLYQIRNLIREDAARQRERYIDRSKLFDVKYTFVKGNEMRGVLIGGNLRCFLKLAGTEYMPDFDGKVLLLESLGGGPSRIAAGFAQLRQLGAFRKVRGVLLGTFTEMQEKRAVPDVPALARQYMGNEIPIAMTDEIGHGSDSKAVRIGGEIHLYA